MKLDSFITANCSRYARETGVAVLERHLLYTISTMISFSPVGLHPEHAAPCTLHWWTFQLRQGNSVILLEPFQARKQLYFSVYFIYPDS